MAQHSYARTDRTKSLFVKVTPDEHVQVMALARHHDLQMGQIVRHLISEAYAELPAAAKRVPDQSRMRVLKKPAGATPKEPDGPGIDALGTILCSKCLIDPGPEVISLEEYFDPADLAQANHACAKCGSKELLMSVPTPPPSADGTAAAE